MRNRLFILAVILFISGASKAQVSPASIEFIKNFKAIQSELPRERVYLHTDRDWYYFGDRIWFSAYVLSGPYTMPSDMSKVLYVELISPEGKLIEREQVKIEKGRGAGSINFEGAKKKAGKYRIRAYTAWILNFGSSYIFEKDISVYTGINSGLIKKDTNITDVQFLPESGILLADKPTKLGFKAVGADGYGRDISGAIFNTEGDEITSFSTEYLGMGAIDFIPEKGESYYALVGGKRYEIPEVRATGVLMNVSNLENQFLIRVKTKGIETSSLLLFAHVRGEVYAATEVKLNDGNGVAVVPKLQIPTGVVHFTLLNQLGNPVSERLSFNKNKVDDINVRLSLNDMVVGLRDRAGFTTQVSDHEGNFVSADMSVTIFDDAIKSYGRYNGDIKSQIYLESEIAGYIENPGYYFSEDSLADQRLGLLLMTQGWRSYDMERITERDKIELFSMPEEGIRVSGKVIGGVLLRDQKDAPVFYSLDGGDDGKVSVLTTDEAGEFWIEGLNFEGVRRLQLKSNTLKGSDNVNIEVYEQFSYLPKVDEFIPQVQVRSTTFPEGKPEAELEANGVAEVVLSEEVAERAVAATQESEQFVDVQMQGELDEITVSSSRLDENEVGVADDYATQIGRYSESRRNTFDLDERSYLRNLTMDQVLNQLPGVSVYGNEIRVNTGAVSVNSNIGPPLILVNGSYTDQSTIRNFNTEDIKSISVLRSAVDLAIFGAEGQRGAIIIQMRDGASIADPAGYTSLDIEGFQYPMEFYMPKYGVTVPQDREKKDNRITLFWEPNLEISRNGKQIIFWTNDIPSTYRIEIEGITESGTPFSQTKVFLTTE